MNFFLRFLIVVVFAWVSLAISCRAGDCRVHQHHHGQRISPSLEVIGIKRAARIDRRSFTYGPSEEAEASFPEWYQRRMEAKAGHTAPESVEPPAAQTTPQQQSPAVALLATKCSSCHQLNRKTEGNLALFDDRGQLIPDLPWGRMSAALDASDEVSQMPPSGRLADSELQVLRKWIEAKRVRPVAPAESE